MADDQAKIEQPGQDRAATSGDTGAAATAAPAAASAAAPSSGTEAAAPPRAKLGRRVVKHGPAADARREADARYQARKSAAAAGKPPPPESAPVRGPATGTSPGYYKQLVKAHEQAAKLTGMPELRIEPEQARELEQNVMQVLGDKGIVLRSDKAHIFALVMCVVAIYLPIALAVMSRMRQAKNTPLPTHIPQRPMQAQQPTQGAPTVAPQPAPQHGPQTAGIDLHTPPEMADFVRVSTDSEGRFPEAEAHMSMDGATVVHGAFVKTDLSAIKGL